MCRKKYSSKYFSKGDNVTNLTVDMWRQSTKPTRRLQHYVTFLFYLLANKLII